MRPFSCACAVVLLYGFPMSRATAQTPSEPRMILTLFGGVMTGHPLWTVDRQPLCVLQGSGGVYSCSSNYDTLSIGREIGSSIVFGVSASYFPSPHVGYQGELYFLGLPLDDACRNVSPYMPDSEARNQQLCDNIASASLSSSAVAIYFGPILRLAPQSAISPYVRGGVGLVTHPSGTVQLSGQYVSEGFVQSREVIADESPSSASVSTQIAAGFQARVAPGYQFRLEVRDAILPLRRVTGPANQLGTAPSDSRWYSHVVFTMGLDIVLEKKRGRRY